MLADILDNNIITRLNSNELTILNYIYAHPKEVETATIRQLAEKLSCSTTTILRFCRKINLTGYSELKYLIKQSNQSSSNSLIKPDLKTSETLSQDIENTLLLLKEDSINQLITEIDSNKSIHLYSGGGISGRVLDYLEKMFFSFSRQNVYHYEASTLAFHIAETLTENDILIVISSSGTYEPTIKMANIAKTHGAKVVAITPYTENFLAMIADINFRFFGHTRKNKNTEYNSRLPIFYIIDAIFKAYLASKEDI
ncbi:MurR/RpiR family transcriptional regulator [Desemzia sp. RIT804]|uniref:MurR/RpiR family transcriptional regulator n=1 Tax=Desemzia sp. RIT 804 TaxID=2810209 RepID=UPI0019510190|nr:MurR/RpiR family transcriptional regulator [Desemzia sp. RIT 804]MBM6615284.1 MurR/RpiR family transcriptional regulator [Desemzia sp. RIT 804]